MKAAKESAKKTYLTQDYSPKRFTSLKSKFPLGTHDAQGEI